MNFEKALAYVSAIGLLVIFILMIVGAVGNQRFISECKKAGGSVLSERHWKMYKHYCLREKASEVGEDRGRQRNA